MYFSFHEFLYKLKRTVYYCTKLQEILKFDNHT